jgi:hypothetical protein
VEEIEPLLVRFVDFGNVDVVDDDQVGACPTKSYKN